MDSKSLSLQILKERFPVLLPRLYGVAAKGYAVDARSRSLDWPKLVERWARAISLKPESAIALSAVGDGSHIRALLKAMPRDCVLYCAEPDIAAFVAFLEQPDAPELLSDSRVFFGCGQVDADFFEAFARFPVLEVVDVEAVIFSPWYERSAEYYPVFFREFARQLDYWRKLYGSQAIYSGMWQSNTLRNLPSLFEAPDLNELENAFAGVPLVLASAGPSLDESLEYLKSVSESCLIVAVNSSYRALRNAGVVPHLVLAADPFEHTDRGFQGVDCDRTTLICPFMVNPAVPSRFVGRCLTWSQGNLLASHLRREAGLAQGAQVVEQGTVSACVFDLARIFGASAIVLLGQDLAVGKDGQTHASDSFYSELGINSMDTRKCRLLPGNTLREVPVEEKLYVYLKTFEQLARERAFGGPIWNASRLGARIEGVPYVPLSKLAKKVRAAQKGDLSKGLARLKKAQNPVGTGSGTNWRQTLAELGDTAREISVGALRGAMRLEMAEVEEESALDAFAAIQVEIEEMLSRRAVAWKIISDGKIRSELLEHRRSLRKLAEEENPLVKRRDSLLSYFWAMAEGSFHFFNESQQALGASADVSLERD